MQQAEPAYTPRPISRILSLANCFMVLGQEQGDVEPGEKLLVQPFAGLV